MQPMDTPPYRELGHRWVRADIVGTAVFLVVLAVALPRRDERPAQVAFGVVSMMLFAIGAFGCLWAYVSALERSRVDEIGVANLYLLTGPTAPTDVRRRLLGCLAAQMVFALAGAIIGAIGLRGSQVNAMAFGILVPMYGLAMNSLWSVRHGRFGARLERRSRAGTEATGSPAATAATTDSTEPEQIG
jgi:hypothetical protein